MKKLLVLLTILLPFIGFAQEQVPDNGNKKLVSDKYNRNSIAVISVARGDGYDGLVLKATSEIPEKYDVNNLTTKFLRVNKSRGGEKPEISTEDITSLVEEKDLGREVVSYVFNRQNDGTMNDSLLRQRGMYNATYQDVMNARASQVGLQNLAEDYDKLIKSLYVMVFDVNNLKEEITKDRKTGKTYKSYSAEATANVYQVGFDFDELWKCWIYEDDDAQIRKEKNQAFASMPIRLTPIARAKASSVTESYEKAVANAFSGVIFNLEKQIDAWQARAYVTSIHPIAAKIGKKENLSNGTRYRAYNYKENSKGDLVSVKRGFVRATQVVDNRAIATEDMDPSLFYQISGIKGIEPGWLLKEDKDLKIGGALDAYYHTGMGLCAGVSLDYLLKMYKRGAASYALIDFGALWGDELYYSASIGAGFQFRFSRFVMLMPYANIHILMDSEETESYSGLAGAGAKLNLQFAYPWQFYVKAGAEIMVMDMLGAESGIYLGLGIRREF